MEFLETERLRLRKLTLNDLEDIFKYSSDKEVTKYVTWEAHQSLDDSIRFLQFLHSQAKENKMTQWGIEYKETGRIIGSIDFVSLYANDTIGEVGYILSRDYWNQGIITEALKEVIQYGFYGLGLIRIEARCTTENIGSARVLEKAGMELEGITRKSFLMKNSYYDLKMYSILKEEFRQS